VLLLITHVATILDIDLGANNIIASSGRLLDGNKICILITTFHDEVSREF